MSNVLDLVDQAVFDFEHATGATSRGQVVWIYNRAIDIDGLRRFHHHLQRGRLSRRIERSPLPFGRHRWVSSAPSELEMRRDPTAARRIRRVAGRASQQAPGCRRGVRMAPCGVAVQRRRRRGELGHLTHCRRRHGWVSGHEWKRLPATTAPSTCLLPAHAGGGGQCARTLAKPRATSRAFAEP